MYLLDTIKFQPTYSNASGNVILSKTVLAAIHALSRHREMMSAADVTYVINNNVYGDEQVSEQRVEAVMKRIASEYAMGYRYNALRGVLSDAGCGFYECR
jgi:hypothetical protein